MLEDSQCLQNEKDIRLSLVRSLLTTDNPFNSTEDVLKWIECRNQEVEVRVMPTVFSKLSGWHFDPKTRNLCHRSGKFFSVVGLDVTTNVGAINHWSQPVINQPEVGYLGIIAKEFDGVLYFLLQAKIEPGNVNCVQLAPTLQATRSNYTCVHGGNKPAYLDYFRFATSKQTVLDQLQSEQGARFYRKRNRNMIVRVESDIEIGPDFRWLTLGQIKRLMALDNIVNMDARTVLSGLCLSGREDFVDSGKMTSVGAELVRSELSLRGVNSLDQILHKLSKLKSQYILDVEKIPLGDVSSDWLITDSEIVRADRQFFRIIGVDVMIANREVSRWCQPIVEPMHVGLCVLFAKHINGVLHFLLQAKVECGNFDIVEFAPSIQCLTGDYLRPMGYTPEYLDDFISLRCVDRILFDTRQSEEGGRFYHEQNRNVIALVNDLIPDSPSDNFLWLTLGQIKEFLRFNNYLNIQVRSLIAALNYV